MVVVKARGVVRFGERIVVWWRSLGRSGDDGDVRSDMLRVSILADEDRSEAATTKVFILAEKMGE